MRKILVWDLFVRGFHWFFAGGFVAAYAIARGGGEHSPAMPWHMMLGLTVGLAALLRCLWLIVGTRWTRLWALALDPRDLVTYGLGVFSPKSRVWTGHNPAASFSLLLMLGLAIGLAATGLQMSRGGEAFEEVHSLLANLFLATAVVHVAGVALHMAVHRDGLAWSMFTGKKSGDPGDAAPSSAPWASAVLLGGIFLFFGSLALRYDPSTQTTRWPLFGGTISLGEAEGREGGEEGGYRAEGRRDEGHGGREEHETYEDERHED